MAAISQRLPDFQGEYTVFTHGDSNCTNAILLQIAADSSALNPGAKLVACNSVGRTEALHDDLTPQFSIMQVTNFDPVFYFDCGRTPASSAWQRSAYPDMLTLPNRFVESDVYANKRLRCSTAMAESQPRKSSLAKQSMRLAIPNTLQPGECTSGISIVQLTSASLSPTATPSVEMNLLRLPPEIRNLIFDSLVVRSEPLSAQVRRVHHLKKGRSSNTISKFPLEPAIARVNHQLRQEVLSILYGSNHFVFEKTSYKMFAGLSMTNPTMVGRWRPSPKISSVMTKLDLRYSAYSSAVGMVSIVYAFRRSHDSTISIGVEVDQEKAWSELPSQHCLCAEFTIRDEVLARIDKSADLPSIAINLMNRRLGTLFAQPSIEQSNLRYSSHGSCGICYSPEFEILYSGI